VSSCCSIPTGPSRPCPSCGEVGPIVGSAPVRPHHHDPADGAWQHCPTAGCRVVYHLDQITVDADAVIAQVAHKATDRPTPVCFCFAHTADDLVADAARNGGASTIKSAIKHAVADRRCACEHLNPSTKCCLADIHRSLTGTGPATTTDRVSPT
jgi:hypothetical protein